MLPGFISPEKDLELNQWAARDDSGVKERKVLIVSHLVPLSFYYGQKFCERKERRFMLISWV